MSARRRLEIVVTIKLTTPNRMKMR